VPAVYRHNPRAPNHLSNALRTTTYRELSAHHFHSLATSKKAVKMATNNMPKSILKKTAYPAPASRTDGEKTKAERDLEVALYHANLIQHQKDIGWEILESMEALIEYPLAPPPYDASNPSPIDVRNFKAMLQPYQPSDYDAMIVERNINDHCGYALCRNKNKKDGVGGKFRIIGKKGQDFKVVERAELEKWCSKECARRALYVRVQLSESPAWERNGYGEASIDLLDEPKSEEDITEKLGKMDLDKVEDGVKRQDAMNLALERGDKTSSSRNALMEVTIKENFGKGPVQPPSLETSELSDRMDTLHLGLEGHTTKFNGLGEVQDGSDGDDSDMDTDWRL